MNHTPTSLYNTLCIRCHCGKSHLSTPHPLHHVIVQRHHPKAKNLVPEHLLPVWHQCMSITTYAPPERSYKTVARSVINALNNVSGSDKLQNVETATDLASEAWVDAA